MSDYPKSLPEFQKLFPDNDACANYLFALRWPGGFRCPKCDHDEAWELTSKPRTFECKSCHHQTSIKAGTILHRSKQPLTIWFWAAWLMATHSNGMSALQLKNQLGLISYGTAWLLVAKLRSAMVDPDRNPLSGLVEIDESSMPYHKKEEPQTGGQGRSHQGKMMIIGAVEAIKAPEDYARKWISGRIRLSVIDGYSAADLHPFIAQNIAPKSTAKTDGHAPYESLQGVDHERLVVGRTPAHEVLPLVHLMFANLKKWAKGTYHGLRPKHLQSYLDEFVFRFNRRHNRHSGFRSLLKIAMLREPMTYQMFTVAYFLPKITAFRNI